jgi:uncharacterized membrane protein YeaQ/YmgE (transglycosylase-associated protein family)
VNLTNPIRLRALSLPDQEVVAVKLRGMAAPGAPSRQQGHDEECERTAHTTILRRLDRFCRRLTLIRSRVHRGHVGQPVGDATSRAVAGTYARHMRRKVPDTWWGAIVVGVLAGAAGGVAGALTDGIWSSDSVAHRMAVFVPAAIAGVVVLSLLKHAQNMRRDRRHA